MVKLVRDREAPVTLKKDAVPDFMSNLAPLVVSTGLSVGEADCGEGGEMVRDFVSTLTVGLSLLCSVSARLTV